MIAETFAITEEQRSKLLKAIENAREYGRCRYVGEDGKPACVIGQLAHLEGISTQKMRRWDDYSVLNLRNDRGILPEYPIELLTKLQRVWDRQYPHLRKGDDAREYMRQLVENYTIIDDTPCTQ